MVSCYLLLAGIVALGMLAMALLRGWLGRKHLKPAEHVRRGMGHAMLGFQGFVEPSVEYIVQAQNVEQKEENDEEGLGGSEEAVRSNLAEALSRSPVDHEEVRRYLAAAVRAGLDWKALFEEAVADELRERPFRAPSVPPARRVAPHGLSD
jgi:hypothetical protein